MAKTMRYELVVVWNDERPREERTEVYEYTNEEAAEKAMEGYEMAFGNQVWCCVRTKYY